MTGSDLCFLPLCAGGCCDCGDPSSWKPEGFCTAHPGPASFRNPSFDPTSILPDDVKARCKLVLQAVMGCISSALSQQPRAPTPAAALAAIQPYALLVFDDLIDFGAIRARLNRPRTRSQQADVTFPWVLVMLHDDDVHSFSQVIDQVMQATHCSKSVAHAVANSVDNRGFSVVHVAPPGAEVRTWTGVVEILLQMDLRVSVRFAGYDPHAPCFSYCRSGSESETVAASAGLAMPPLVADPMPSLDMSNMLMLLRSKTLNALLQWLAAHSSGNDALRKLQADALTALNLANPSADPECIFNVAYTSSGATGQRELWEHRVLEMVRTSQESAYRETSLAVATNPSGVDHASDAAHASAGNMTASSEVKSSTRSARKPSAAASGTAKGSAAAEPHGSESAVVPMATSPSRGVTATATAAVATVPAQLLQVAQQLVQGFTISHREHIASLLRSRPSQRLILVTMQAVSVFPSVVAQLLRDWTLRLRHQPRRLDQQPTASSADGADLTEETEVERRLESRAQPLLIDQWVEPSFGVPRNLVPLINSLFFQLFGHLPFKEAFAICLGRHYKALIGDLAHLGEVSSDNVLALTVQVFTIPSMTPKVECRLVAE